VSVDRRTVLKASSGAVAATALTSNVSAGSNTLEINIYQSEELTSDGSGENWDYAETVAEVFEYVTDRSKHTDLNTDVTVVKQPLSGHIYDHFSARDAMDDLDVERALDSNLALVDESACDPCQPVAFVNGYKTVAFGGRGEAIDNFDLDSDPISGNAYQSNKYGQIENALHEIGHNLTDHGDPDFDNIENLDKEKDGYEKEDGDVTFEMKDHLLGHKFEAGDDIINTPMASGYPFPDGKNLCTYHNQDVEDEDEKIEADVIQEYPDKTWFMYSECFWEHVELTEPI
jgi:hypothetical protein